MNKLNLNCFFFFYNIVCNFYINNIKKIIINNYFEKVFFFFKTENYMSIEAERTSLLFSFLEGVPLRRINTRICVISDNSLIFALPLRLRREPLLSKASMIRLFTRTTT